MDFVGLDRSMTRETLEVDVLIVGGGPAGLSAALRLSQLQKQQGGEPLSIAVLEKAREAGAHILSGAVLDPSTLRDLIPDFQARGAPLLSPVQRDNVYLLTERSKLRLPIVPPPLKNHGNYLISLSQFVQWLAQQVEGRGHRLLHRLCRSGRADRRHTGDRCAHRRSRRRQARRAQADVRARRGHTRQGDDLLRRCARQSHQETDPGVPVEQGPRAGAVRGRTEGAVGHSAAVASSRAP